MRHFTLAVHKSIRVVTLGFALVFFAACSGGGSSPTEPFSAAATVQSSTFSTRLGNFVVFDKGCKSPPDLAKIEAELYTTADIAMRQNPSLDPYGRWLLDGFELHLRPAEETSKFCGPTGLACFIPQGGTGAFHVWCDGGGVEHETAHGLAWGGDLPCWRDVYHGIDFRCEPS